MQVEILDLSHNSIVTLDGFNAYGFMRHLRSLHIASNAIHTIGINMFVGLRKLQNLSLADNRLESFDAHLFEPATRLQWLDLSGNKLMDAVTDEPLLRSRSIRELILARSHITFIGVRMLSELPALQRVDLSDNLLIQLHVTAFLPNRQLEWLNLVNNPFNCDDNLQRTLQSLKRRKVEVINWDCGEIEETGRNLAFADYRFCLFCLLVCSCCASCANV